MIVVGMHRSGTSMVTRMLEEMGMFVGKEKTPDHEATFFLDLNSWILRQSGGSWDNPEPIRNLLRNPEVRSLVADYVGQRMKAPSAASYVGWPDYFRGITPQKMGSPWGWKDPRNTYTLPLWLDLFPEARIVHVYRHGVDIAGSLKARETMRMTRAREKYSRRRSLYRIVPKRGTFAGSVRCTNLEDALELWASYLAEAKAHTLKLSDRAVELKYEDFLAEPRRHLTHLARFCGLPDDKSAIERMSATVDQSRACAYRNDPELRDLAEKHSGLLGEWGYG